MRVLRMSRALRPVVLVTALTATLATAMAVEQDDLWRHQSALFPAQLSTDTSTSAASGAAFAQHIFRDPGIFCEYLCDFSKDWVRALSALECRSVRAQPYCEPDIQRAFMTWNDYPAGTVADACPEVAARGSADFSLSSLSLPAGVNLIVYGHSHLKQIFQVLKSAQEVARTEYLAADNADFNCTGGAAELAQPRCLRIEDPDAPVTACHSDSYVRYTLINGATVTGVLNYEPLQHRETNDAAGVRDVVARLDALIRRGAGASGAFTHALVMEPHGFDFFDVRKHHKLNWYEEAYGCGWSEAFWQTWNRLMPAGTVQHVLPFGFDSVQVEPAAPTPALSLNVIAKQMPCHTVPQSVVMGSRDMYTVAAQRNGPHGLEEHLCIAAKDGTGYFLGPVAYMAQAAMRMLWP